MNIHYLNTDLELHSPTDLTPIVKDFGDDVINLYNGKYDDNHFVATFEIAGMTDSPDSIIQHFCMFAEVLNDEGKKLWDACFSKTIDIGYASGTGPRSYASDVRPETIERMAGLGLSMRITIYPIREE